MKVRFALLSLALATTASLHAQPVPRCSGTYQTLNVRSGEELTLPVTPVEGATRYRVQMSTDWSFSAPSRFLMKGNIVEQTFTPGAPIRETFYNTRGDFAQGVYVAVISEVPHDDGTKAMCAQDFLVEAAADPAVSPLHSARLVVPVAGSLHGAFNSVFKTRIVLENRWSGAISGRILFHRAGVAGSLSDPFLSYSLQPYAFTTFDDVVGAMHLDGAIGSLDILPDAASSGVFPAPQVRADLISLAANGGEYSSSLPVVSPGSTYPGAIVGLPKFLIEPRRNKRINVGVRTLGHPLQIDAFLLAPDGTERARTTRTYDADFFEQTPLSSWFQDQQQPGDTIEFFSFPSGSPRLGGAIVFLAETDNATNDVTILSPTDIQTIRQPLIVCANGDGCATLPGLF